MKIFITTLLFSCSVFSQIKPSIEDKWILFSSPKKTFTIRLPKLPSQRFEKIEKGKEYLFNCTKTITYHFLKGLSDQKYNRLEIIETDVSLCQHSLNDFNVGIEKLLFIYGVNKDNIISDNSNVIDGFPSRSLMIKKEGNLFISILALKLPKRVFLVIYDRLNGNLHEEKKILTSMRPKS